jgi:hypothetical protein
VQDTQCVQCGHVINSRYSFCSFCSQEVLHGLLAAIREHRDGVVFRNRTTADFALYSNLPEGGSLAKGTGDVSGLKGAE